MSYHKVKDVVLKDGHSAELGVAIAPETDWQKWLCAYLNATPEPEAPHFHSFLLIQDVPGLEVRYFVMLRGGEIIGCIFTTDGASVGYINSTFVARTFRQLGIAGNLMDALEADFSGRGGKVRFLTTRTGSPAEKLFEKIGYQAVWERSGRTGMEKHYNQSTWEDVFLGEVKDTQVEEMTWAHWNPHRALMWIREGDGYHPLVGNFLTRIQECVAQDQMRWKALVLPDGRLVGTAVLRPHDRWGKEDLVSYVLDLYVHPRFRGGTERLFEATMPDAGHVQIFLDRSSKETVAFFLERGFRLETSLRDDFNHHDPTTPDVGVYGQIL